MVDRLAEGIGVPPWERRTDETDRAYAAFATYRDLGSRRSLRSAADKFFGEPGIGATAGQHRQIEQWSSDNQWVDRVRAFDAHKDQIQIAAAEDAVRSMVERDIAMAQDIKSRVAERLAGFNANELNPVQLARWFELAVRVEREARGLAGDQIEVRHSGEVSHDSAIVRAIVADPIATEHALATLERVALVGRQSGASRDPGDRGDA